MHKGFANLRVINRYKCSVIDDQDGTLKKTYHLDYERV